MKSHLGNGYTTWQWQQGLRTLTKRMRTDTQLQEDNIEDGENEDSGEDEENEDSKDEEKR